MYGWNNINSLLNHPLGNNIDEVSVEMRHANHAERKEHPRTCIDFMVTEWEAFEWNVRILLEEMTNKQNGR